MNGLIKFYFNHIVRSS